MKNSDDSWQIFLLTIVLTLVATNITECVQVTSRCGDYCTQEDKYYTRTHTVERGCMCEEK